MAFAGFRNAIKNYLARDEDGDLQRNLEEAFPSPPAASPAVGLSAASPAASSSVASPAAANLTAASHPAASPPAASSSAASPPAASPSAARTPEGLVESGTSKALRYISACLAVLVSKALLVPCTDLLFLGHSGYFGAATPEGGYLV